MKKHNKSENHKGVPVVDVEVITPAAITNRAAFLAGNPAARAVHDTHLAEFRAKFAAFVDGLKPMLFGIVNKAESARQIGLLLIQWSDTLPGKKFTRDFYEQHKGEFTDAAGQSVRFELLEWFMRVARGEKAPVDDLLTAWKCRTPMLLALGIEDEAERPPGKPVMPADPLANLNEIFNPAEISQCWKEFTANPRYCPNGQVRADLKPMLAIQWKPTFETVEAVKKALGI